MGDDELDDEVFQSCDNMMLLGPMLLRLEEGGTQLCRPWQLGLCVMHSTRRGS